MQLSPDLKTQGFLTAMQGYFLTIEDAPDLHLSKQEASDAQDFEVSPEQAINTLVDDMNKKHRLSRQQIIQILEDQVKAQILVARSEPERTGGRRSVLLRGVLPSGAESAEVYSDRQISLGGSRCDIQEESDQAARSGTEKRTRHRVQGSMPRTHRAPHAA